jgi:hypothetical protein
VLADTPEEDVQSIEGKEKLQKRLTAAINKVLVRKKASAASMTSISRASSFSNPPFHDGPEEPAP